MMIATLLEADLEHLKAAITELEPVADAYEIRFDALTEKVPPATIRALTKRPLVGTVRRPGDGGNFTGAEHDRLQILEDCLQNGFEHVDVEGPTTVPGPEELMIRSRHELRATPSLATILRMADEITRNGALFKFAAKTQSFADILVLLTACRRLQQNGRRFAIMGLGEFPRVLTHLLGAHFIYGGGRTNAPGQPAVREVRGTLEHWGNPKPASNVYLVAGDPIVQSLSPKMHNAAFQHDQADAAYGSLRVTSGLELQMLLEHAKDLVLGGLSITTPLKDAAFDLVQSKSPEAERAEAVNAIRIDNDQAIGHNTDGLGARAILSRLVKPGARVLVAGTGGAARAVAGALAGYEVTVAGRNGEQLRRLATRLEVATTTLAGIDASLDEFDVLVNATRVDDPIPMNGYHGALFDLHYRDGATRWSHVAEKNDLRFAGGRDLLLEQGCLAYEFWTKRKAPRSVMAAALGVTA
ncbi:MAG TPA: type I 3-dehydroquinate dehydratase [Candidatus Thermoplasmatota archaeon]